MDDPVCHVVAADHVPQPLSGSRTADSFFSFFMPSGSKSASLRMVTQRRTFCMRSFVYSPVCLPVIYIFAAYHPLIFTLACIPPPHRIQLFFPHISCPDTAASIVSSCAGPPIPPALPPPYSQRPRSSFASYVPSLVPLYLQLPSSRYTYSCPRPAILTVALVPLYLQSPSLRPLSGRYAASESLPFERSFRLLYCFANDLPLPVDSYCIQCLMHEKLSCFR